MPGLLDGVRLVVALLRVLGIVAEEIDGLLAMGIDDAERLSLPDDPALVEEIEEDAAYAPYLSRHESELRDLQASEALALGDHFPFAEVPGLSREMVERLEKARPANLGAASRIPGITPAALASRSCTPTR